MKRRSVREKDEDFRCHLAFTHHELKTSEEGKHQGGTRFDTTEVKKDVFPSSHLFLRKNKKPSEEPKEDREEEEEEEDEVVVYWRNRAPGGMRDKD